MSNSGSDIPTECPECGALAVTGLDCREQLAALLGWETQDPDLFGLHFYTVACFNLQHPAKFTDDAIVGLRKKFQKVFDGEVPLETLRLSIGQELEESRKVLRDVAEIQPSQRRWDVTIAEVYGGGPREAAAYRVRRWASAVRDAL